jgi:hypothetical protein
MKEGKADLGKAGLFGQVCLGRLVGLAAIKAAYRFGHLCVAFDDCDDWSPPQLML